LAVAGVSVADLAYEYLTVGRYLETTDDAYVKADSTIVAPKVSGYIDQVLVSDNESVKAGQVLARIDDRDFLTALKQAKADVAAADRRLRFRPVVLAQRRPRAWSGIGADPALGGRNGRHRGGERRVRIRTVQHDA
jgi:membrane fusion protein (multidrug efflux system)